MTRFWNLRSSAIHRQFALVVILAALCVACHGPQLASAPPLPEVSVPALTGHVAFLTGLSPARNHLNIESLDRAAAYIKQHFQRYGYTPVEQPYDVDGRTYKNVMAVYGPADGPRLIIGAHYDVFGEFPGADDNASAVAGLLEIARLLQVIRPKLDYRIELVAFTLEEPPYFRTTQMGSHVHARGLKDAQADVIGMICLEMIGYFSDEPKSQQYPMALLKLFYPSRGDFIVVVSNANSNALRRTVKAHLRRGSVKVRSIVAPAKLKGVDFSDHLNYWQHGYPAVMVTDTAFYRNANYHKASDTADTLNYEKMAEVVKGVYSAAVGMQTP